MLSQKCEMQIWSDEKVDKTLKCFFLLLFKKFFLLMNQRDKFGNNKF